MGSPAGQRPLAGVPFQPVEGKHTVEPLLIVVSGAHTAVGRATLHEASSRGAQAVPWTPKAGLSGATVLVCGCPGLDGRSAQARAWLSATGQLLERARDQGATRVVARSWVGAARGHTTPMFTAARGLESLVVDAGVPYVVVRVGLDPATLRAAVPRLLGRALLPGPGTAPLPFHAPEAAARALLDATTRTDAPHGVAALSEADWRTPAEVATSDGPTDARRPRRSVLHRWRALRPWFTDPLGGLPF
jgi:hypothetical protein